MKKRIAVDPIPPTFMERIEDAASPLVSRATDSLYA
jgi:hypothetical protein